MKSELYLLNISVSGIKNIKEEVRLDFYKKTVDRDFDPERYRVKAIYGENGSGKSAIITAVKIFQDLIMRNNYLSESKTQGFLSQIVNKTTQTLCFGCEFRSGLAGGQTSMVYRYSFRIGRNKNGIYELQYEILQSKNGSYANNNYKTVYECKNGELGYINSTDHLKELMEKVTLNLLPIHSFLHLFFANTEKINELADFKADEDRKILRDMLQCAYFLIFLNIYIGEEDQHERYFLQRSLQEKGLGQQAFMEQFLEYASSWNAFSAVNEKYVTKHYFEKYKKSVEQLTQFIKIFKPGLVSIDIDAKEHGEEYVCELNLNYGDYVINREFESTGIKKLIRLFDCFVAASGGGIVFVDEMDSNLNDVYLCRLIEYFMYYGKGQLCFTTHNLDPMAVLKENRNAIDFLSNDNHLIPWTARGNASPENCYKNGMIEDLPFNVDASDFVGIFGE